MKSMADLGQRCEYLLLCLPHCVMVTELQTFLPTACTQHQLNIHFTTNSLLLGRAGWFAIQINLFSESVCKTNEPFNSLLVLQYFSLNQWLELQFGFYFITSENGHVHFLPTRDSRGAVANEMALQRHSVPNGNTNIAFTLRCNR